MQPDVTLRQMEPADGMALADLFENSPDSGRFAVYARYQIDPYRTFMTLDPSTVGVVAEKAGGDGLAGVGLIQFGRCRFEGEQHDYALLHSLMVHPGNRNQGIATQLAQWRVDYARRQLGNDGLIVASIQENNAGSLATAQKWSRQFIGRFNSALVRTRTNPPAPVTSVSVRMARTAELDGVAQGLNRFYQDYNLYTPEAAETLAGWLGETPFDEPWRHYYVAVDNKSGDIVAGLAVTEQYKVTTMNIQRMPGLVRALNKLVKMVPADGILRQLAVDKVWFAPGQLEAARFLWESVRWQWRDRGSHLVCSFDPRGPLPAVFRLPFWMPKAEFRVAVSDETAANQERLIYPL